MATATVQMRCVTRARSTGSRGMSRGSGVAQQRACSCRQHVRLQLQLLVDRQPRSTSSLGCGLWKVMMMQELVKCRSLG